MPIGDGGIFAPTRGGGDKAISAVVYFWMASPRSCLEGVYRPSGEVEDGRRSQEE